jgi:hypothetical protein
MCEDCETETLHQSYAQKRALIAAYWRPARSRGFAATNVSPNQVNVEPAKEKRAQS